MNEMQTLLIDCLIGLFNKNVTSENEVFNESVLFGPEQTMRVDPKKDEEKKEKEILCVHVCVKFA